MPCRRQQPGDSGIITKNETTSGVDYERTTASAGSTAGLGPRPTHFEVFLEPTCPFSVRAFNKLDELLDEVGADNVTIKIRLQSQPWHLFSGVIVRCILAASTLPHGREQAHRVLKAVADHREEFEFTDHCSGPNMETTPQQIIQRIERYSEFCSRRPSPALSCRLKLNGIANTRDRTVFMSRLPLWSTVWCSRTLAAATISAYGPRGLWPESSSPRLRDAGRGQ